MDDKSGIYSLAGFAYQIKIFILKIVEVKKGETLEYETADDIARNIRDNELDEQEANLCSVKDDKSKSAIQVKKTCVSKSVARKVVRNWLLLNMNNEKIDKYILVTDRDTENDVFEEIDKNQILDDINNATGKKSIDSKIKAFGYTDKEILEKIDEITLKISIEKYDNIDKTIEERFSDFFIQRGIFETTYLQRVKQLLERITSEILQSIHEGKPYIIAYDEICRMKNGIIIDITDLKWEPSYSRYRRLNRVRLDDLAVVKSREYLQLIECENLSCSDILRYLQYGEYYQNSKRMYYERGMNNIVDDIEITAYDNFCDAKIELRVKNEDIPDKRLIETEKKNNSKANDDQIKKGVCIYLTGEDVDDDIQISWKDK